MAIQPGVGYTFTASSQGTNFSIQTPWAAWAAYPQEDPDHPFKIVNVYIATTGGSTSIRYQVVAGSINNLVPVIGDYVSGTTVKLDRVTAGVADPPTGELVSSNYDATTKTSYITLRSGIPVSGAPDFPDSDVTSNRYPVVIGGNVPYTPDTDTYSYLTIGTIAVDNITTPTTFTVTQFVTGSLWADRIKLGTDTAQYYYARI